MLERPDYRVPMKIRRRESAFVVVDRDGIEIASVRFEEPRQRGGRVALSEGQAKPIAQFIAQTLTEFHPDTQMRHFMERLPHYRARLAREGRG